MFEDDISQDELGELLMVRLEACRDSGHNVTLSPDESAAILARYDKGERIGRERERAEIVADLFENYGLDGFECDHGFRLDAPCPNEHCNQRTVWQALHHIEARAADPARGEGSENSPLL